MAATKRFLTVEELERTGAPEGRWELINGELVELPLGGEDHGAYGTATAVLVGMFVLSQRLGRMYGSGVGFVLSEDPPTVRVADGAFVRYARLSADRNQDGFVRGAPDFVIEVVSFYDRPGEALARVMMWIENGVPLAWLVDPEAQTVTAFTPDAPPRIHTIDDTLDGGDVSPGFTLPVRDIFSV